MRKYTGKVESLYRMLSRGDEEIDIGKTTEVKENGHKSRLSEDRTRNGIQNKTLHKTKKYTFRFFSDMAIAFL